MAAPFQRTEGIILRAFPFRDYDQILTLFTANAGIVKIICYGSRSQKSKWRGLCSPLTRVEVVYRERKSEIFSLQDMALVDAHDHLRRQFVHLEIACDILNSLYETQLVGKPSPRAIRPAAILFEKDFVDARSLDIGAQFSFKIVGV